MVGSGPGEEAAGEHLFPCLCRSLGRGAQAQLLGSYLVKYTVDPARPSVFTLGLERCLVRTTGYKYTQSSRA